MTTVIIYDFWFLVIIIINTTGNRAQTANYMEKQPSFSDETGSRGSNM